MNKLILELAHRADPDFTGEYDDDMSHAIVGSHAVEEFARLVACEVINIMLHYTDVDEGARVAREHFEIK